MGMTHRFAMLGPLMLWPGGSQPRFTDATAPSLHDA